MRKSKPAIISPAIKLGAIYLGTVTGAGFASGKEMAQFFSVFGTRGLLGIGIISALFITAGWAVLEMAFQEGYRNLEEMSTGVFGKGLGLIIQAISGFFMFVIVSAMVSAGGAIFSEFFNYSFTIGAFGLAFFTLIILFFDISGLAAVNVVLCPVIILGSIFLGVYSLITVDNSVFTIFNSPQLAESPGMNKNWYISGILYVSYNMILTVTVLAASSSILKAKKDAKRASVFGGCAIGISALFLFIPILLYYNATSHMEIPMLAIASSFSPIAATVYVVILLAAIIATSATTAFALLDWISSKSAIRPVYIKFALVIGGFFASHVGFSGFVARVYPFFGYLGLFELAVFILYLVFGTLRRFKK